MSAPKSYLDAARDGTWPFGPFVDGIEGQAARRQGEIVWLLRNERRKRGLSQESLARLVGVQRTVVTHFETGARWTDTLIIWSLAAALEVETAPPAFQREWPDGPPRPPGTGR